MTYLLYLISGSDPVQRNSAVQTLSRSELLDNKGGIVITGAGDFGDPELGDEVTITFTIT